MAAEGRSERQPAQRRLQQQSLRGLLDDLCAGLPLLSWNQWRLVQRLAREGRQMLAVGDPAAGPGVQQRCAVRIHRHTEERLHLAQRSGEAISDRTTAGQRVGSLGVGADAE